MRSKLFFAATLITGIAGVLASSETVKGNLNTEAYPVPEGGTISNGIYQNSYFALRYPLPAGWTEDVKGAPPSTTGYYSLVALKPKGPLTATVLISAQDNFFSTGTAQSALDFLMQMKEHLDPSLAGVAPFVVTNFPGKSLARFDYSGAGLHHSLVATEIRCHMVIFGFTSSNSEEIERLIGSLKASSFGTGNEVREPTAAASAGAGNPAHWPMCIQGYAKPQNIIRRVDPAPTGPRFASVPVRIVIGAEGTVKHVHAIAGFPEQIQSMSSAVSQWRFKPYRVDGRAVEIETGLLIEFPTAH
jgi:hypothetical protein